MVRAVVCIAPGGRLPRAARAAIAARLPGVELSVRSIAGYLATPRAESRIVLVPAGASVAGDVAFLRRAASRILWPAPSSDFRDAIGGLRTRPARPRLARWRSAPARDGDTLAALLLEGRVDPPRMRAVLASQTARDWIVESPAHVRLPARWARSLERAGVRWAALEPVELVAVSVGPALARRSTTWRRLLPPRTAVWVRP